jgi:hypothetical protein
MDGCVSFFSFLLLLLVWVAHQAFHSMDVYSYATKFNKQIQFIYVFTVFYIVMFVRSRICVSVLFLDFGKYKFSGS